MAHSAREAACTAMASKSADLSEKLDSAAAQYDKIDQQQGARIDSQMHPR